MAIAISAGTWKRRSTKPSRTPFRRPIRFQPSSRRRAGAPAVPDPFIQRGRYDPKAPGIIKFFQANEVLRREKREERQGIIPALWARMSLRQPVFFLPGHRHSVVAAHGLVVAEPEPIRCCRCATPSYFRT